MDRSESEEKAVSSFEREYLKAVKELYYWQYSDNPTNFTAILFRLMQKADPSNRRKLRVGFPIECAAYQEWCASPTQDEFFEKYGLNPHGGSDENDDA